MPSNYPPGISGAEPEIAGYDEDYARDLLDVTCETCGRDVYVVYAVYEPYAQCWICDECLGESEE